MKKVFKKIGALSFTSAVGTAALGLQIKSAEALELDWSGQFWSELNGVFNYSSDAGGLTDTRYGNNTNSVGGYFVPQGGRRDATFQSLFLRLKPKAIINDNISIKSEWWVLDPIFGLYGSGVPFSADQNNYFSTQNRGATITAQRFWGEFVSDIGTFQVGRVPLNWGLGLVWNGGDNLWDRYMSTGDAVRLFAKFGSFTFAPSYIIHSTGNSIGSQSGINDFSLILKYENTEDELEGGVNLLKRMGGVGQTSSNLVYSPGGQARLNQGMNLFVLDFFARKRFKNLTLSAEVPIAAGEFSNAKYDAKGVATELDWKPSDSFGLTLKAGYASGQKGSNSINPSSVEAFYFNPNYRIGMIMFNYQLANFSGNQTGLNSSSPYFNPIVNAYYGALSAQYKPSDKWTIKPALIYAMAPNVADSSQNYFYNYWTQSSYAYGANATKQGNVLGFEADLGISFQWDEYFTFALDTGVYFPGNFYKFSNLAGTDIPIHPIFATAFRVGINF